MGKLKPCPFCGDENIHLYFTEDCSWVVGCNSVGCICLHTEGKLYKDKRRAIDAWNRRAEGGKNEPVMA